MPRNTSSTPDKSGRWIVSKFGGPDVLKWDSWDPFAETLPADHVIVRIITAGIAGTDNIQRVGGYPDPRCSKPGFTLGYDFIGEVVALGSEASKRNPLSVGDRVTAMDGIGAHATHIILPAAELIRVEKTDDPVKFCAIPLNYSTAFGMLKRAVTNLVPGSSILIGSASGGVGTAVAELVNAFKMDLKMIGTCSPSKFDYIKSLGVIPVDRRAPDLVNQVRALTGGEGVDVAYDAVGSDESIQKSLQATKKDVGQVIVIGAMSEIAVDGSGVRQQEADLHTLLQQRLQSRVAFWSVISNYKVAQPKLWHGDLQRVFEKVRSGELSPTIAKLFRLRDAVKAHETLISGTDVKGKMLFIVDEDLATQHGL
ncbi:NAD(P)-binding protein [Daldinia caldariorum]|uniref:NAD(P)-binding protein n=1 Tax=Daldinia caldariorum TaxID=326644 RepID=UPI0020080B9C|nr:NAD(P)-binding protein [Daldinia caldariorum]KAI1471661.1 NAD(P)-binding protein [Daldinia caldariorum]